MNKKITGRGRDGQMILPLDRHVPSRVHSASVLHAPTVIVRREWHQLLHRDEWIDGEHEMALFHPFEHLNSGDMCLNLSHQTRNNLRSDGSKVANVSAIITKPTVTKRRKKQTAKHSFEFMILDATEASC